MSQPDSDHVRARIRARLAELDPDDHGRGTDGDVVTLDQQRVGRLTRMDALQAQAMAGAVDARRARERRRLRQALARLDAGSWGLCMACDDAIAPARLEIDPAAEHCIACAAAAAD
ncbi:MAG: TraR/DksA C4-type zinc finger protein [Pseudomonadales bacterium]|nr:TraR/DksA C4-type zinc finger protein [Pseudomonadales bacterium]